MATGVGLRQAGFSTAPAAARSWSRTASPISATWRRRTAPSSWTCAIRRIRKLLATFDMQPGTHSHKVRVANGLMVINQELNHNDPNPGPDGWQGGICIYDVSTPSKPRLIARWNTDAGRGVHRFDFDGRYVYMSATQQGYVGNIMMIMDLMDPAKPTEVGRWWMPGQWTAGGETPTWEKSAHRCHHPLRMGNRLYTSYWMGGFVDPRHRGHVKAEVRLRSRLVAAVPLPDPHRAADAVRHPGPPLYGGLGRGRVPPGRRRAGLHVGDRHHQRARAGAGVELSGRRHRRQAMATRNTGCHQPCEKVFGTEIPFAWFAQGLRIIDIKNPQAPREVAWYMPDRPPGTDPRVEQRSDRRRPRPDLSDRPPAGPVDCRADMIVRGSQVGTFEP